MTKLLAGDVGKPHGIAGEVYVVPISDDPRRFDSGSQLTREDDSVLVVESARVHGTRLLVKFAGVDSRTHAETLRGPLYVDASKVRALEQDEFWEHDLVGCEVVDPAGVPVGPVVDVQHGPGQARLVVATASGARLVPLVKDIVVAVDVGARRITVDAPEGLWD